MEMRDGDPTTAAPLPLDGKRIPINPGPALLEGDIMGVSLGHTDHYGSFLRFQLNAEAARDLSRMSTMPQNRGLHLVLVVGGQLIGETTINGPITSGQLDIFPQVVDEGDIVKLADGINAACYEISRH